MSDIKTKCFITMWNVSKSEISRNFGPLIEHGPYWIKFNIITFISEKNEYSRCLDKICNKIISFDMKKKGNLIHDIRKMKKKVNSNL
jgi:hypothetical protein